MSSSEKLKKAIESRKELIPKPSCKYFQYIHGLLWVSTFLFSPESRLFLSFYVR